MSGMSGGSSFVLFCKSYSGDLKRMQRLWQSVRLFNRNRIPLYISVPQADRKLFEQTIGTPEDLIWVSDEDIARANPRADLTHYQSWDGRLSQQVVKSEFWRYAGCDSYLCLDSESEFIRDFTQNDFLDAHGNPYTVMHQAKELLQLAANKGMAQVAESFCRESAALKAVFGRVGPDYDFGPTPVIWSARVWHDLDEQYLKPRGQTLWDAIAERPAELRWYGEALLQFKSIPLLPIEPLFRVYHYDWQFDTLRHMGERPENLETQYLGILCQSNWQYELDYGAQKKSSLSRANRWLKRKLAASR
ncbi:MAG: hypothetical protein HYS18_04540 [Burkholderiales bacterium]|nr:hypothetical protein [Burkholderiales bacterium]